MRKLMFLFAFLGLLGMQVYAQKTITGTVTSAKDGSALAGVSVVVKGTTIGTITDVDGKYTLSDVPDDAKTLVFSFIGYKTAEVPISGNVVNVSLEEEAIGLGEIVVTGVASGTPTTKLGFAVGKVKGDEIEEVPAMDPANALRGKVSGVTVVQGSGNPLSAPAIRLRGSTTITGSNSPLIIVDGVITNGSLNDINVQDIKSIEVVKGSAGSSLYGSLAGNGVIQIITKKGSEHQGFRVVVRNEVGVQKIGHKYPLTTHHPYQLNADGTDFIYAGDTNLANRVIDVDRLFDNNYPTNYPLYDEIDAVFKPNIFYSNFASLSGNRDKMNFYTSFENDHVGGVINGMQPYNRRNLRVNLNFEPSKKFKFSINSSYSNTTGRDVVEGGQGENLFYSTLVMEPIYDLYQPNPDGTPYIAAPPNYTGNWMNPLYVVHNKVDDMHKDRLLGGLNTSYKATDWLTLMADYSLDKSFTRWEVFYPKGFKTPNAMDDRQYGSIYLSSSVRTAQVASASAKAQKKFGKFNMTFVTKYMLEHYHYTRFRTKGSHFTAAVHRIDASPTNYLSSSSWYETTIAENIFGALTVDYADKLIFDGMVRRDASSRFGADARYKIYYRAALAYRLTQDITIPGVQEFKLRASYGTSGMRPPFNAQYETYSVSESGISPSILGNKDLKPTQVGELELGIDVTFLDKWSFEFNYSDANAKDQYLLVPLSAAAGFTAQWRNAATIRSTSLEGSLYGTVIESKAVRWDVGFTASHVRQMITELDAPAYTRNLHTASDIFRVEAGQPYGVMYGNVLITSLDQLTVDENGIVLNDANGNTVDDYTLNSEGYVILKGTENTALETPLLQVDSLGTPVVTAIGNSNPLAIFGLSNTVTYKGFGLYFLVDVKYGGDVYNYTRQLLYYNYRHADFDYYAAAGKKVDYTGPASSIYNKANPISHFVEDGSYVKVRELSISYTINQKMLANIGGGFIKSAKFSLTGRNLFTLTRYKGWDPEVAVGGDTNWAYDEYSYPNYQTYSVALKLTF